MTRARRAALLERKLDALIHRRKTAPVGTRNRMDGEIFRLRTLAMELALPRAVGNRDRSAAGPAA